jgi:hypothetical protein
MSNRQKLHYNVPQLLFHLVQAAINVVIWGRATGKTEGPMAFFTLDNIHKMPRSNGFLLGTTYEQLLTRTIPPLIAGWEKLGYVEGIHFFVRKFAPDYYKWPKAWRHPLKAEHYIHWYNGSGIYLVSQDRPGTINGVRTQWGAGDEAKFLNKEKLDNEALLTMAGHADKFSHLSNYLSLLFCSDMPTTSKGKWLLEYQQMMEPETIEAILMVQSQIIMLQTQMQEASDATKKRLQGQLNQFEQYLNELRKETVYFSMASTLDNIHALGLSPIKQFKRTLSDLAFQISVLNKQILAIENGFYGLLNEDEHGYEMANYAYIDNLYGSGYKRDLKKDCRWDGDIQPYEPLDIACDYNNSINCVCVGQENHTKGWEYRLLNSMYVLNPLLLKDCIQKFHDYYQHHKSRYINYYYDHTAIAGNASSDLSYSDEWIQGLTSLGWHVTPYYIGQAPSHHSRYLLWSNLLQGQDSRLPRFGYNITNAGSWSTAAKQAGVLKKGEFFEKDKSSEKQGSGIPPYEATHQTDAADTLIYAKLRARIGKAAGEFFDTMVI